MVSRKVVDFCVVGGTGVGSTTQMSGTSLNVFDVEVVAGK